MVCPKCSNEMVEAKATSFGDTYQYCRSYKRELKEILADTSTVESPKASPMLAYISKLYGSIDFSYIQSSATKTTLSSSGGPIAST